MAKPTAAQIAAEKGSVAQNDQSQCDIRMAVI